MKKDKGQMRGAMPAFLRKSCLFIAIFTTLIPITTRPVRADDFNDINDKRVVFGRDGGVGAAGDDPVSFATYGVNTDASKGLTANTWNYSATVSGVAAPVPASGGPQEVNWAFHVLSPRIDEELIAISGPQQTYPSQIGNTTYCVFIKNPQINAGWVHDVGGVALPYGYNGGGAGDPKRPTIAIGYEQRSGNALIIYRDTSNAATVNFQHIYTDQNGARVATAKALIPGLTTTGNVFMMKLIPQPNSDDILALIIDGGANLYTYIWEGQGGVSKTGGWTKIVSTDKSQGGSGVATQSTSTANFSEDAVYLPDGTLVLAYYESGVSSYLCSRTLSRGASKATTWTNENCSGSSGIGSAPGIASVNYVKMAVEPTPPSTPADSSHPGFFSLSATYPIRIAFIAIGGSNSTFLVGTMGQWDGATLKWWGRGPGGINPWGWFAVNGNILPTIDPLVSFVNFADNWVPLDVAWAGLPGSAFPVVIYSENTGGTNDTIDNNTGNGLAWATWDNTQSKYIRQPDALTVLFNTGNYQKLGFILNRSFTSSNAPNAKLTAAVLDENFKLWLLSYDPPVSAGGSNAGWTLMTGGGPLPSSTTNVSFPTRSSRVMGRPFDLAAHRYKVPVVSASAASVTVPVADASGTRPLSVGFTITDPGGMVDDGDDSQIDNVNYRDVEVRLPSGNSVNWLAAATVCVSGTAKAKVQNNATPCNPLSGPVGSGLVTTAGSGSSAFSPDGTNRMLYLNLLQPLELGDTLILDGMTLNFPSAPAVIAKTAPAQYITVGVTTRSDYKSFPTDGYAKDGSGLATTDTSDDIDQRSNGTRLYTVERLDLSNVAVKNAFVGTVNLTGKSLLKFQATAVGGDVKVTRLNFGTILSGLAWSNVSKLTVSVTGAVGSPAPVVHSAPPALANADFTGLSFTIAAGTTATFTLSADFAALGAGQTMQVSLPAANVEADGTSSGINQIHTVTGAISVVGAAITKLHTVSTYTPSVVSPVVFGKPLTFSWTESNVSHPSAFKYSVDALAPTNVAKTWMDFTGALTSGMCPAGSSSPCDTSPTASAVLSNQASSAAYVALVGTESTDSQTVNGAADGAYSNSFKILETLQLGNPAAQVKNALLGTGSLTNLDLLAVKITSAGGAVAVTQLNFTATPGGPGAMTLTNYQLLNGSGSVIAGPQATPNFSGLSGAEFNIAAGVTGKTYTLRADISGLVAGQTLTVQLASAGVSADGVTSAFTGLQAVAGTVSGGPISTTHTVSTYSNIIITPLAIKYNDPIGIGWTNTNVANPTLFEYSTDGKTLSDPTKTWVDFTGLISSGRCPAASASPCNIPAGPPSPLPTSDVTFPVTTKAYIHMKGNDLSGQAVNWSASPAFKILERINLQPGPAVSNVLVQNGSDSGDAFSATGDLLKIQLTATGGDVKVTNLNFDPPATTPVNSMSFTAYEVYDGATRIAGPITSPTFSSINNGNGLIITKGTSKVLTLRGTVSGIDLGETLTVSIQPSGVVSTGQITGDPLTVDGVTASQPHTASGYQINVPTAGGQVVAATEDWTGVDPAPRAKHPIAWTTFGNAKDGSTGNAVNLSYTYVDVLGATVGPNPLTCNAGTSGAGVCDAVVPVNVSDTVRLQLTDGTHTVVTKPFTIKGIVQITGINPLNLPGLGATWLLGYTKASPAEPYQTVDWEQLGSFSTTAEIFDGVGWREIKTMPIVATGLGPYHMDCVALGSSTCANNFPIGGTDSAQIRVRPADAVTTSGNKIWPPDGVSTFKVRPAFISITPGGSPLVKGRAVPIKWTPLPGTAPLSADPSSVLPVDSVIIKIIDGNSIVQQTITPSEPNDGQWCDDSTPLQQDATCWKPQAVGSGLRVQICDKQRTTMCGYSAPFDVIDVFVKIGSGAAGQTFVPNSTQTITWGGIDISKSIKLMLKDPSGNVILDVIRNLAPPVTGTKPSVPATHDWTIPNNALVPTPMAGAVIRMEQSDDASVWAETLPFDLRGELQLTSPNGGDKLLLGAATSINWTVKSGTTSAVRIRYSKTGLLAPNDPGWTTLSFNTAFSGTTGSFSWSPGAVTKQGRVEICDVADLNVCATSASDFTVAGKLTLGEHSGGQASNAFVELPTVNNVELYRFALAAAGETVNVTSVQFDLSSLLPANTWQASDIPQLGLSLEQNGIPVTASFSVGPVNNPSQIVATLTGVSVNAGASADFVLKGTINNLDPNDEMTIGLAVSGIQAQGSVSQENLGPLSAISGSIGMLRHVTKTYLISVPAAGQSYPVQSPNLDIAWSAVGGADPSNVKITLSTDGGATYPTIIANSASVLNPFRYSIPLDKISSQAKIKIEDRNASTVVGYSGGSKTSNFFNITGQIIMASPSPDLRYADSLPRWPVGSAQTIQWSTVGTMTQFKVYSDATLLTGTVTQLSSSTFKMDFTPGSPSSSAVIKVVDNTAGHPPAQGPADGLPNVVFSEVQVLQPNQTDAWLINSPQTIRWIHTGLQTVDLFYRVGSGLWQPIALAQDALLQQLAWNPPAAARGPQVEIRIVDSIDQVNGAVGVSDTFKVYGQLQLSPVASAAVGAPVNITWTTTPSPSVPTVNLYLIDVARSLTSTLASNLANGGSYNWTPGQATSQAKLRVCDKDFVNGDPQGCNETTIFPITGIGVDPIPAGPHLVGSQLPISWTQQGVAGGQVRVAYSPDGGTTWKDMTGAVCAPQASCGTIAATGPTGSLPGGGWTVVDDISNNVLIRVADAGGSGAFGLSNTLGITGQLTVTSPAAPANVFSVTDTMPIRWTTLGTIPTVHLEYSLNGGTSWSTIASGIANSGSYDWVIPMDVISNNFRVRIVDAAGVAGPHPFTEGRSGVVNVGAKFAFTSPSPAGTDSWAVNSPQTIGWNVTGVGVTSVKLAYSADGTTYTTITTVTMAGTSGEAATLPWNVADVVDLMGDPQVTPSQTFMLRITDATSGHPAAAKDSASATAFYYKVNWEVRDASTNTPLNNLQVSELPQIGYIGWTNAPDFNLSGIQPPRYYPYLTQVSTLWSLANNNGASDMSEESPTPEAVCPGTGSAPPCSMWVSNRNQTRIVKLEVTSSDAVTWQVKAEHQYDSVNNIVEISAWLEKSGKIVDTLLTDAYVELYADGALIRTLPVPVGSGSGLTADSNGNFRFTWDLKDAAGVAVADGKTYFAKTIIRRLGRSFSTGGGVNITIPKKIMTSGAGGGGPGGPDVSADVAAIKAATVGPGSSLEQIKTTVTPLAGQIAGVQTGLDASITNAKNELKTDIADVKSDTTAIRADTAAIRPLVEDMAPKVTAILSDPNAGLPSIKQAITDQGKTLRRGGILNRDMELETGENATIQYRSEGGAPSLSIYDQLGAPVAAPALILNSTTGFYESTVSLASLGAYRVVVSEPSSANSNGTLDSITLTVVEKRATQQDTNNLTTLLTNLSTQLTQVELNLDGHMTAIENAMATKGQADQIIGYVDQLEAKWGSLDAAALMTELSNLSTKLGTPPVGSTVSQEIQAVKDAIAGISGTGLQEIKDALGVPVGQTVYGDMAKQQTLAALDARVGTPTSSPTIAAAIEAIGGGGPGGGGSLGTVEGKVDRLLATVGTTQLETNGTNLANELSQVKATGLDTNSRVQAIQADVTAIRTVVDGLPPTLGTDLTNLQAAVDNLVNTIGTPAQQTDMLARFDAVDNAMNALSGKVDLTAKQSDLLQVKGDVGQILTALNGLPPTLGQDLANLQTALTNLANTIGSPAQQTDMQTAFTAVNNAIAALDAKVDLTAKQTDLDQVKTDVGLILTAVNTLPPTLGSDIANLKTTLDGLVAAVGTPAQDAATQSALSAINGLLTSMDAKVDLTAKDVDMTTVRNSLTQLALDLGTVTDGSGRTITKVIQDVETAIQGIPGAIDYSPQLATLQGDITQLKTDVGLVPKTDYAASFAALQTALTDVQTTLAKLPANGATSDQVSDALAKLTTLQAAVNGIDTAGLNESTTKQLNSLNANVDSLKSQLTPAASTTVANSDTATLLTRLDALQKSVESAQGSSAAVGFSQGAYSAASDALKILQQLQKEIETNGAGSAAAQAQLGQFGDKIKTISSSISVIPNSFKDSDEELNEQIKKLAQKAQGIASDKGYHFDSLYEMSKDESSDVKAMRNRVEELKNLLDVQRSIIERNMNQPVVTTWFEAR